MKLEIQPYSAWKDTAWTLHMLVQMMGKVKLGRMPAQPEWNHTLLHFTPCGFDTGLIPQGETSFSIAADVSSGTVAARCTSGLRAGFALRERQSISWLYAHFRSMLRHIGHETAILPVPQEVPESVPYDAQTRPLVWDGSAARRYFQQAVFAHNALSAFAAPFRGKKILPSLFWGTFDVTTVLFSGREAPFSGEGIIERVAFDEQFIELGFWPGDAAVEAPSFFVLPYPFVKKDLSAAGIQPKGAYWSHEKMEFFLPLSAVLEQENPTEGVLTFCRKAFASITEAEDWPNVEWFTKPLLI